MCSKKVIEILVTSLTMKKLKIEKIEFRAYIKIRAKLGVSAHHITDELVFAYCNQNIVIEN